MKNSYTLWLFALIFAIGFSTAEAQEAEAETPEADAPEVEPCRSSARTTTKSA